MELCSFDVPPKRKNKLAQRFHFSVLHVSKAELGRACEVGQTEADRRASPRVHHRKNPPNAVFLERGGRSQAHLNTWKTNLKKYSLHIDRFWECSQMYIFLLTPQQKHAQLHIPQQSVVFKHKGLEHFQGKRSRNKNKMIIFLLDWICVKFMGNKKTPFTLKWYDLMKVGHFSCIIQWWCPSRRQFIQTKANNKTSHAPLSINYSVTTTSQVVHRSCSLYCLPRHSIPLLITGGSKLRAPTRWLGWSKGFSTPFGAG